MLESYAVRIAARPAAEATLESLNSFLAIWLDAPLPNVADDVKYLAQIGLIEKKETRSRIAPVVTYEKLMLEIAV